MSMREVESPPRTGRRILFYSYWPVNEPLTDSTLIPYFRILQSMPSVERVDFVTVEREDGTAFVWEGLGKVVHTPVRTRWDRLAPLSRWDTIRRSVGVILDICRREGVDVIDSKGAVAGIIARKASRRAGVPLIVESYEPHADYMADSGVWSRLGPYYNYSKWQEALVERDADHLVTVTDGYREHLVGTGVPAERISVVPSVTDLHKFRYSPDDRHHVRSQLGIDDRPVGVYLGKFGGLYYQEEAYRIFGRTYELSGRHMHILVLTGEPRSIVQERLEAVGIPRSDQTVFQADHVDVPRFLSASDMAFSTIRYLPHGKYQSPVKNGEYWASGLPILLTDGVSDDHRIIRGDPRAGAVYAPDLHDLDKAIQHVLSLVREDHGRDHIMGLARRYRSMEIAERCYERLFGAAEQ